MDDTAENTREEKPLRISAGGVILGTDGRIVVVHQAGNSWSLPKGGVEGKESLLEAARREIFEETGIDDLELVEELGTYDRYSIAKGGVGENRDLPLGRRTFFLFRTNQAEFTPTDGEITEARWVSIDEALALLTHPKDGEFLASVRDRIR
jgi:8-oxo-dGTP pyrophosphatase MutT (NUDIX family)